MSEPIARLLAELDPLPYPDRMRALAAHAAEGAAMGTLAGLIAELRTGDTNERHLAITMAAIAGDATAVVGALTDPDQRVRAIAVRVSLRAGWLDAPALVALMQDAPADLRRLVYKSLRGARRPGFADALVEEVRGWYGDAEAARLLPACSAKTVERLIPDLDHAVANWTTLATRHGDVVLDHAERVLPNIDGQARSEWWRRCGVGVLSVGVHRPERVLHLLERFAPSTYLPGDLTAYGVLAAASAPRVVRLLTSPGRAPWLRRTRLPAAVLDRLGRGDPAQLVGLGERLRGVEQELASLLDAVAPARRGQLFDDVTAAVDTSQAVWCDVLLEVLPRRWREREARRILSIAPVRDDEARVLHYTAHLPWEHAAPVLVAATRRADPDDRAAAYELLLAAARSSPDPAAAATVVEQLGHMRNEQDPVRARALIALSRIPHLLRADSVEALTRLVVHATEARDASSASLSALSTLAVAVVRGTTLAVPRCCGGHRSPWNGSSAATTCLRSAASTPRCATARSATSSRPSSRGSRPGWRGATSSGCSRWPRRWGDAPGAYPNCRRCCGAPSTRASSRRSFGRL